MGIDSIIIFYAYHFNVEKLRSIAHVTGLHV